MSAPARCGTLSDVSLMGRWAREPGLRLDGMGRLAMGKFYHDRQVACKPAPHPGDRRGLPTASAFRRALADGDSDAKADEELRPKRFSEEQRQAVDDAICSNPASNMRRLTTLHLVKPLEGVRRADAETESVSNGS